MDQQPSSQRNRSSRNLNTSQSQQNLPKRKSKTKLSGSSSSLSKQQSSRSKLPQTGASMATSPLRNVKKRIGQQSLRKAAEDIYGLQGTMPGATVLANELIQQRANAPRPDRSQSLKKKYGGLSSVKIKIAKDPGQQKPQEVELRKQIAIKERQLAEMSEQAQRMKSRISVSQQQLQTIQSQEESRRPSAGRTRNAPIDTIQTSQNQSNYSKIPSSSSRLRYSQAQLSKRERDILMKDSHMIPTKQRTTKSPAVGGGLRSQKMPDNMNQEANSTTKIYGRTSPLRVKHGSNGTSSKSRSRSPYPYAAIDVQQDRNYSYPELVSIEQVSNQRYNNPNGDISRTSPLRQKSVSRSRSPPIYDIIPELEDNSSSNQNIIKPYPVQNQNQTQKLSPRVLDISVPLSQDANVSLLSKTQELDDKLRKRIDSLTIENEALEKRLQVVQTELVDMHQEIGQMGHDLKNQKTSVQEYEQLLSPAYQDSTDQQNRTYQDGVKKFQNTNQALQDELMGKAQEITGLEQKEKRIIEEWQEKQITREQLNENTKLKLEELEFVLEQKKHTQVQLDEINAQYDELSKEQLEKNHENIDLDTRISAVRTERLQLLSDIKRLTVEYDDCARDISKQQYKMDAENRRHAQNVSAKVLMNNLCLIESNLVINAFKDLKLYCTFDKNCQEKLTQFAVVAEKIGHRKMQDGLRQWYDNSLKPLSLIQQNEIRAESVNLTRLKTLIFHAWKTYHYQRIATYMTKTTSINLVWEKLCLSYNCEIKRSLAIWKVNVRYHKLKKKRLAQMIIKSKNSQMRQAIHIWKVYNRDLEHAVRVEILKREYAYKFYLTTNFNAFKQQVLVERHSRIMILRSVVKAWKDSIKYKRHMMQANMATIKFEQSNTNYMIRVCFDALMVNKEKQKHKIMTQALTSDMDVALEEHAEFNRTVQTKMAVSKKQKSCTVVKDVFGRILFSYLKHWKDQTDHYKITLNTKVKDKIFQMYRGYLISYFLHWRKNSTKKKQKKKKMMIQQMQQETSALEQETMDEQASMGKQAEEVRSSRTKQSGRICKKLLLRIQQVALLRWREKLEQVKVAQESQKLIIHKMRKRLLIQAFTIYKTIYMKSKQHDRNVSSSEYFQETLQKRTLRKVFNAYCCYLKQFEQGKKAMKRIISKIDQWNSKRAIKQWRVNANVKRMEDLEEKQLKFVDNIEGKNKDIGQSDFKIKEQEKELMEIDKSLKQKGRKLLANHMMRYYSSNTEKRFKFWKELVNIQKQREELLKRTIQHWRKCQMMQVKAVFKTFISQQKQAEKKTKIKKKLIEQEEHQQSIDHNNEVQSMQRKEFKKFEARSAAKQQKKQVNISKSIDIMSRRNIEQIFKSKKRVIFEKMRHVIHQEIAFAICIKNVLEKSMKMKGFVYIKDIARNELHDSMKYKMINRMFHKFSKTQQADCFNKWKHGALKNVEKTNLTANINNEQTIEKFNARIKNIKRQNCHNAYSYFYTKEMSNIWQSWVNTTSYLKMKRKQDKEIAQLLAYVKYRRSIQKWKSRVESTKRIRNNVRCMKQQNGFRMKRAIWDALVIRREIHCDLATSISNLEKLFRDKNYAESFQTLQLFTVTKKYACKQFKVRAAGGVLSILNQINNRRTRKYFGKYRAVIKDKCIRNTYCKKIIQQVWIQSLRDGFRSWAKWMKEQKMIDELNQTGPVTEEVFEADRTIHNLKEFMRKERYTEEEIEAKFLECKEQNNYLMNKVITVLKITPRANREALIKCWQHWRMWIKVKRLMKYHLRKGNHQLMPIKADLMWAFDKWKRSDAEKAAHMDTFNFQYNKDHNIRQSWILEDLADNEAETSAIISHLNLQRDELLENYIRSQKLALILLRDNHRRGLMQAWTRWKEFQKAAGKGDGEAQIYQAVQFITAIKLKVQSLEVTNRQLAKENDELRQFSVGGFQIAKNVQELSLQREQLLANLDDQEGTLQKLMDDNMKIKSNLAALGISDSTEIGKGRLKGTSIKNID